MFTDPVSVTRNAVAVNHARIRIGAADATYQDADGVQRLKVSHQVAKSRTRRMARFEVDATGTNPLTGASQRYTTSCYVVVDEPSNVFSRTEVLYTVKAMIDFLNASNQANTVKILANEV